MIIRSILSFLTLTIFVLAGSVCAMDELKPLPEQKEFKEVLNKAKRIRTSDGWFEVIEMPNNILGYCRIIKYGPLAEEVGVCQCVGSAC